MRTLRADDDDRKDDDSAPKGWTPIGTTTQGLFLSLIPALDREAASDPEPDRFSLEWREWRLRALDRGLLRAQVLVAGGLSEDPEDPAPFGAEDLPWFLAWCERWQEKFRAIALGEAA
jgi:hypothetical protein